VPPPQSTPVSFPLLTPSLHAAVRHVPPPQILLVQSVATAQALPGPQGAQVPPQSVAVSLPFWILSSQRGATQSSPVHTEVLQSDAIEHALPTSHFGQIGPPQFTSVSVPSRTELAHD
jgi:hypothetical protein